MTVQWNRISPKGAFLGALTDLVATNVFMVPVVIVLSLRAAPNAAAPDLVAAINGNPWLFALCMGLGCLASALGGWVAARVARHDLILNGALSAMACVGLGVYAAVAHPGAVPVWKHALFAVLSPALGAAGGMVRAWELARWPERAGSVDVNPPTTSTLTRVLLVINWMLRGVSMLLLLLVTAAGITTVRRSASAPIIGFLLLGALMLGGLFLLTLAARALRAQRAHHWLLHAGGAALICSPVLLVAVVVAHRAT